MLVGIITRDWRDFSRQLGNKGCERMGPKGLEIRAENLDFFLKEAHASEALFREDNPLRDAEETCPNLVSLYLLSLIHI